MRKENREKENGRRRSPKDLLLVGCCFYYRSNLQSLSKFRLRLIFFHRTLSIMMLSCLYASSFLKNHDKKSCRKIRNSPRTMQPPPPPNNTKRRRKKNSCSPIISSGRSSTKTHPLMSAASSSTTAYLFLLHLLLINQNNIRPANAHGFLSSPRSRNYVAYQDKMWSEDDAAGSLTPVPWPEDCKYRFLFYFHLCVQETLFVI